MKIFRNILLYLAFVLLMLHSLVPHHHHDEHGCDEAQVTQNSTEGFDLFHPQLGEGHLEHFFHEEVLSADFASFVLPAGITVHSPAVFTVIQPVSFLSCLPTPAAQSSPSLRSLRAPPAQA